MQYVALVLLPVILAVGIVHLIIEGVIWVVEWFRSRRERRIARIEAELDRTQAQMRATILQLAEQLGADAHEARKALIHEAFMSSGQVPPKQP
jgi:hypothetical protein